MKGCRMARVASTCAEEAGNARELANEEAVSSQDKALACLEYDHGPKAR